MSFLSSLGKTNVGRTLQSNLKGLLSSIGAGGSLGSLGDVVFEVSSSTVRTIDNLAHNTKARLAKHDIIGKKPVMEFLGPDGDEVSFDMRFSIYLGINPKEEADKLRKMCEKGEAMELIMGNQPIGAGKFSKPPIRRIRWSRTPFFAYAISKPPIRRIRTFLYNLPEECIF